MADKENKKGSKRSATSDELTSSSLGLHTDFSPSQQPEGTYPFALNAIGGSKFGSLSSKAREVGNIKYANLPLGFTPIGKVYIGDGETALFLVKNKISEIGILNSDGNYTTHVNDSDSSEVQKLGFRVENQIDAIYRLRRGCQKTIYFVGKGIKPMTYDFSSPEKFKSGGNWDSRLFYLQKLYSKIPEFSDFKVFDTGGEILSGSYNFSIQYIDSGLNPTEWITSSEPIIIYNDSFSLEYRDISGSMTSSEDYMQYEATDKAIEITIAKPDRNYDFYRLAIIVANSGSGQINEVQYTDIIPIEQSTFTYTGRNFLTTGTESEILSFTDIIEQAESIVQLQNMLMLGNIQGNQSNFCNLQKYASRITADCVLKKVNLSSLDFIGNPKRATHKLEDVGYMPGEIYSFAIVYILENGVSPAYHIPGKSPLSPSDKIYSPDITSSTPVTFPMSSDNNISGFYTATDKCGGSNYWGNDFEGVPLKGKQVRHHRFPLRSELGIPLVRSSKGDVVDIKQYQLQLSVNGDLLTPITCEEGESGCSPVERPGFEIKVEYVSGGESYEFYQSVNPDQYAYGDTSFEIELTQVSPYHLIDDFNQIKISISDSTGTYNELDITDGVVTYTNNHGTYFNGNATFTITKKTGNTDIQDISYETDILGIKFSNVEVPKTDEKGNKIIGYYIVRNERTEFEKSILDSGVLIPTVKNEKYIGQGLLNPEDAVLEKSVYGVIHPEHKFKDKKYTTYDEIIQQGNYKVTDIKYGKVNYDDVYEGSSFNEKRQKEGNDDGGAPSKEPYTRGFDGFSLNVISRDSILEYEDKTSFSFEKTDIKEHFYLSALESRSINKGANDVYNIAADNKIGIIQLEDGRAVQEDNKLPYVIFKKNNLNAYSNFRLLPYYKESKNPIYFSDNPNELSETTLYSGDSYVTPMRYVNTVFWDNRIAKRVGKTSALTIIVGAIIIVVGAVLAYFTGGSSLILVGVGIALIGGGALLLSSGIKQENWNKAYGREYDKGLRLTALDAWVKTFYQYTNRVGDYFPVPWTGQTQHAGSHGKDGPSDDTIQWVGDCLTNLWFESTINTSLRVKMTSGVPNFLAAPGKIESGQDTPISLWEFFKAQYTESNQKRYPISSLENHLTKKLLAFDPERNDGQILIGVPLGEYYQINPDYERKNTQKIFTHLPIEYDCCSDCKEKFPHRWKWSQQSFQEELTDNYQVFLPNNYKDIEGETGSIMNFFTLGDRFFIHTEEALYEVPKNQQERVTDQVVSFIGTGSYFDIPPRKIVDSFSGNSAGLQHKWGATKTDGGYFFICESQRTIFQFTGESLIPVSKYGISKWFWNNIKISLDEKYRRITKNVYPYRDNPSSVCGTGFIVTQDLENNRILFTKRDFDFVQGILEEGDSDSHLTFFNGNIIKFENYQQTINIKTSQGYTYLGIEDGKMKFSIEVLVEREVIEYEWVPPVTNTTPTRYIDYVKGRWRSDDPVHSPPGGSITYKTWPSGVENTLSYLYEDEPCVAIEHRGIVSTYGIMRTGCDPLEVYEGETTIITPGYYRAVPTIKTVLETTYEYVEGTTYIMSIENDKSWTISLDTENPQRPIWTSWHSYLPNFYITMRDRLFSWRAIGNKLFSPSTNSIWEHNKAKTYCTYYGKEYPYIMEYVLISSPVREKIYNHIGFNTIALKYNENTKQEYEDRLITFNKAIVYNSHQCSGLLELNVENKDEVDYMMSRVKDEDFTPITKDKDTWFINDLRDIRVNYEDSIWDADVNKLQDKYYIDKVLNVSTLDVDKSWEQLESFRGKYLIVRLIFDKFADVNLISNFIVDNETLT